MPILHALQRQRRSVRWPLKISILALVTGAMLYPSPLRLRRHLRHIRSTDRLTDPTQPELEAVRAEFLGYAARHGHDLTTPQERMQAVEGFVYERIRYAWDWETWGVADYLPTLPEVLASGREDCDGRALLAAALLRSFDVNARLVADPRHVWVRTPSGDLMNPLGPPVFQAGRDGVQIRWAALLDPAPLAFGVAVFPLLRELIILITAWLLLLPPRMSRSAALLALLLLIASLMLIRVGGADPAAPRYGLLAWAGAQWPIAGLLLLRRVARHEVGSPPGLELATLGREEVRIKKCEREKVGI